MSEQPFRFSDPQAEIDRLRLRVAELREDLEHQRDLYESDLAAARATIAQLTQERDEARAEIERLEWAVKQFRDGELLNAILSDKKQAFEQTVNETLGRYGYGLDVQINGKRVENFIGKLKGPKVAVPDLSEGELLIAQWAIANAFAAGTPVLIDNADGLSYENKAQLMEELKADKADKAGGTKWFSGAWGLMNTDLTGLCAYLAPSAAIWIDGGKAKYDGSGKAKEKAA